MTCLHVWPYVQKGNLYYTLTILFVWIHVNMIIMKKHSTKRLQEAAALCMSEEHARLDLEGAECTHSEDLSVIAPFMLSLLLRTWDIECLQLIADAVMCWVGCIHTTT